MRILLSHGGGGKETAEILQKLVFSRIPEGLKKVGNGIGIDRLDDGAVLDLKGYLIVSVDSYTVKPLFFPGGDIGKLAACGSINDVAMMGGRPIAMLDAVVMEEGLPEELVEKALNSMFTVLRDEGVALIGGDLKVMPKGELDQMVITTVGLGVTERPIVDDRIRLGDELVVSGTVGDHGATILAMQKGIKVEATGLRSDVRPLNKLMDSLVRKFGDAIHAARDPTRGGLAMALNDWSKLARGVAVIYEENVPVKREVKAYSDMLGIDYLYLANEGMALLAVEKGKGQEVVEFMKDMGFEDANVIGEMKKGKFEGFVLLKTTVGGFRIIEPASGSIVPRIC